MKTMIRPYCDKCGFRGVMHQLVVAKVPRVVQISRSRGWYLKWRNTNWVSNSTRQLLNKRPGFLISKLLGDVPPSMNHTPESISSPGNIRAPLENTSSAREARPGSLRGPSRPLKVFTRVLKID